MILKTKIRKSCLAFGSLASILFFGGKILSAEPTICFLPAPPPVFAIPFLGILLVVGPPKPATVFYTPGMSRLYAWFLLKKDSWTLGTYGPMAWLNCPPFVVKKIGVSK